THENVSQQMTSLINRLNDFLGLSSLVAFFLAGIGTAFLYRSYFQSKLREMAVLLSLGSSPRSAGFYYLFQMLVLGLIASTIAIAISLALVPGLEWVTESLVPFDIQIDFDPMIWLVAFLLGTIGCVFICLPVLGRLWQIKPLELLQAGSPRLSSSWKQQVLLSLPSALGFFAMSVWLSHSLNVGALFTGLFFGAGIVLSGISVTLFFGLSKLGWRKPLYLVWALRDLSRHRFKTLLGFITIGLGSLLLNVVPQLQQSLQTELERPDVSRLPSLFMFDIQEEQLEDFKSILKAQKVELDQLSPMIRSRLMTVNGEKFDKGEGVDKALTREEEREMRFRNRGINLSYKDELSESETLFEGEEIKGSYVEGEGLPLVSVEKRFADRLNLKIGDELVFDIESIPVTGKVANLRTVRWTSFRPNFFVQFQPGVLEIAPKTYLATVPFLGLEKKWELQDALVSQLPNVSMVDVSRIVSRISGIMDQMSWALLFMSLLCLVAGFVVIFSIANHQVSSRGKEVGLLKTLGASFKDIRAQFYWQYGILSMAAFLFGVMVSLVVSYMISSILFVSIWVFSWKVPLATIIVVTFMTLVVTHFAIN
ncbi:MAG: FtsX-like permease family protein, partial [Bdellovibrionales bacterium]|nr:FtsX-like permease family protein [Bdellovibrionales bacterium]